MTPIKDAKLFKRLPNGTFSERMVVTMHQRSLMSFPGHSLVVLAEVGVLLVSRLGHAAAARGDLMALPGPLEVDPPVIHVQTHHTA